jgi:hypothetical protein
MLTIHVLNVGHGNSAIVEFDNGTEKVFGVVDSNVPGGQTEPRALTKLRQLGATRLSFVCLTHPHADHFKGLHKIINAFEGSIDYFYSCPFGALFQHPKRLQKFAVRLREIYKSSEGKPVKEAQELLRIIMWATEGMKAGSVDWRECAGEHVQLAERGSPFTTAGFARMVERAGTEAKLGFKAHPHMLRHACGFALAAKGHDTRALQAYLGHKNIQHTVRYTELSPDRFKDFWRGNGS